MRIKLNAYEHQNGSIDLCTPHSLSFTLLITSPEGFVYRIAKFGAQARTGINQNSNDIIPITFWVMSEVIMKDMLAF